MYEPRPRSSKQQTNACTSGSAKRPTPPATAIPSPPHPHRSSGPRRITRQDISQTQILEGADPAPLAPPSEPVEGDSHAHLLTPLEELAAELGYTVREVALKGTVEGWCDPERHEIVLNEQLPANGRVRVLVHEVAHALGVGYAEHGRARAEVIVDAVTYISLKSAGLDVSCDSVSYLATWGGEDTVKTVRETAELIDRLARRIEQAIAPPERAAA